MKYKLSEIADIISGGTPKKKVKEYWHGNIPWITIKDFKGKYVNTCTGYITQTGLENSPTNLTEDDDILISARGTVGELVMAKRGMTFNQSIYAIRVKRLIADPSYIYYWLSHNINRLKKEVHGSVFDTITKKTFDLIQVNLPSLEVQQKIAQHFSLFDRKITLNERINANLVNLIDTIYNNFCLNFSSEVQPRISNVFNVKSSTYKIKENKHKRVLHFSIPNFDNSKQARYENTSNIKSNKIIVNPFSVLISKLNPRFQRIWAPSIKSVKNNISVASPEFLQISGSNPEEQAVIFAIVNSKKYYEFLISNATGSTNSRQRVKPAIATSYVIPFNIKKMKQLGLTLRPLLQQIQENEIENIFLQNIKINLLEHLF